MSTSNGETDPSTWATNMIIDGTKGYVGIANINPLRKLHVGNGSDLSAIGRFSGTWNTNYQKHSRLEFNDRNFGIGAGKITTGESGTDDDLYLWSYNGNGRDIRFMSTSNGESDPSTWKTNMIVKGNTGNIGIGTLEPGKYKLAVEGKIGAREIEVKQGSWADFVFYEDYELKNLSEVESFINENKHLPDVPSEQEVKEKGINLGQMDAILLQKIEELTLYLIGQNKTQKKLMNTIQSQQTEIKNLKKEISSLKK